MLKKVDEWWLGFGLDTKRTACEWAGSALVDVGRVCFYSFGLRYSALWFSSSIRV